MTAELILAIDQGTTSSRAIIYDAAGRECAVSQQEIPLQFPHSGWVNQDPRDLRDITLAVATDALRQSKRTWTNLAAIGITNQRETTLLWDRATGEPVAEAIVWQSRQSADVIRSWEAAGYAARAHAITGLVMDAYFSASKIRWLLDRDPALTARAKAGDICFGTVDSWLIWHLTGGLHITDTTNASRTMLFDITRQTWSDELLENFGIPQKLLPEVVPSSGAAIRTSPEFGSVPISGIAGDQHASLFGHMCFSPGMAKSTYGTGAFVVMNTGSAPAFSQAGLLTSPAWSTQSTISYGLEGAVLVSGSAVQWLRDGLGIIDSASEIESLAASVPDAGGVVFVPALTGLGAPEWDPDARGLLVGISRGTNRAHIARATLDAIAAQVASLTDLMASEAGHALAELRVDGGASRNNLLMQIQADLTGVPVTRSTMTETTAFGVALLAGLGVGLWSGPEAVVQLRQMDRQFDPQIGNDERTERLTIWRDAVQRALGWAAVSG